MGCTNHTRRAYRCISSMPSSTFSTVVDQRAFVAGHVVVNPNPVFHKAVRVRVDAACHRRAVLWRCFDWRPWNVGMCDVISVHALLYQCID